MNAPITGLWYSGRALAAHPVTFQFEGTCLRIDGLGEPQLFDLRDVRISDRLGSTARFLYLPRNASIESLENDAIDACLARRGAAGHAALIHWLEQRTRIAAVATVLLVATVAAVIFYGLPIAARYAAFAVPDALDQRAGAASLAAFDRLVGRTTLPLAEQDRVRAQLARLAAARRWPVQPQLEFRSMGNFPNAFTLPGGILVFSDELVRLANDDELAAVLAHEAGHWQHRHGLQTIFSNSAAFLVLSSVTGDLSTLTTFSSGLPLLLLQRGYSRVHETEADDYALATLRLAKIDPRYLATILTKLERARPTQGNDFSYLSTHPATADRITRIDPSGSYKQLEQAVRPAPTVPSTLPPEKDESTVWIGADVPPRPIQREPPEYPLQLRAKGVQGKVRVGFIVDSEGNVRSPTILSSSHRDFEAPVLAAIAHWRFEPGKKNGRAVNTRASIDIPFTLSEEAPSPAAPEPAAKPDPTTSESYEIDGSAMPKNGNVADLVKKLEGFKDPVATRQPAPQYPSELVQAGVSGRVTVLFAVNKQGEVQGISIVSSPDKRLSALAKSAVRAWSYDPQPDAPDYVSKRVIAELNFIVVKDPSGGAAVGRVTVEQRSVTKSPGS